MHSNLQQTRPRFSVESNEDDAPSHNTSTTATGSGISVEREEHEGIDNQETKPSPGVLISFAAVIRVVLSLCYASVN